MKLSNLQAAETKDQKHLREIKTFVKEDCQLLLTDEQAQEILNDRHVGSQIREWGVYDTETRSAIMGFLCEKVCGHRWPLNREKDQYPNFFETFPDKAKAKGYAVVDEGWDVTANNDDIDRPLNSGARCTRCGEWAGRSHADTPCGRNSGKKPDLSPPWVLFINKGKPSQILPAMRPGSVANVSHLTMKEAKGIVRQANALYDLVTYAKLKGIGDLLAQDIADMIRVSESNDTVGDHPRQVLETADDIVRVIEDTQEVTLDDSVKTYIRNAIASAIHEAK